MTTSKSGLTDKFRPPATKVCRVCEQEKPIKNFAQNVRGRSGYANECRACKTEQDHRRKDEQKENAKTFFDAKYFTLFLLLSVSLTAFSQESMIDLRRLESWGKPATHVLHQNPDGSFSIRAPDVKPDTLRAYILATMCRKCAAEAIPGYVVIEQGKRPVYLDCKKRALKWPQVGWDFREVDKNYKK